MAALVSDCYDAFYKVIRVSAADNLRRALEELLELSNLSAVDLSKVLEGVLNLSRVSADDLRRVEDVLLNCRIDSALGSIPEDVLNRSGVSAVNLRRIMLVFFGKRNIERSLERLVKCLLLCRFWESHRHNVNIKLLDPTKMTQEAYLMLGIIELFESWRLHQLPLTAMTRCVRALKFFLALMVEISDSKAKIQEIKAKIQDKFNYNGNCKVKIGIIPEGSGTPFLKMGVLRPAPMFQKVYSAKLVLPSNWGQAYIPGI